MQRDYTMQTESLAAMRVHTLWCEQGRRKALPAPILCEKCPQQRSPGSRVLLD